jgi:hypothetical protein
MVMNAGRSEELRREAQELFLGSESVVIGIGLQSSKTSPIVFLLRSRSRGSESRIRKWAKQRGIDPSFQVVGGIKALR